MNARDEFDKLQRLADDARAHGEIELAAMYDAVARELLDSDPVTVRCALEYWRRPSPFVSA